MTTTPGALIKSSHNSSSVSVRADLTSAHIEVWEALASPGTWWTGHERLAIAQIIRIAIEEEQTVPPWESASSLGRLTETGPLSAELQDAIYRLAAHAGTLTEDWYSRLRDATAITPEQWVEVIEIAASVVSVLRFAEVLGLEKPDFPPAIGGEPSRKTQPSKPAKHHWVPVVHLEEMTEELAPYYQGLTILPPVVRALSSVPSAMAVLFLLSSAQYIPMQEMADLNWSRGTLSRRQIEFVAGRLSAHRECFY